MYKLSKDIALLFAGSLIGIFAVPYEEQISNNIILIALILVLIILYGIGVTDWIRSYLLSLTWRNNSRLNYVCIYAPYEISKTNSSWIDVTTDEIIVYLKNNRVNCGVSKTELAFEKYPIIINPYGGVYPEKDASSLESLNRIFDYVKKGGIYINIADIPFYYAYDSNLQRRIDITPLANDFSLQRSFLETILTKKLNHYVFALTKGKDFDLGIKRVIQLSSTSINLFEKSIFYDGPLGSYSPILKIPYGKGYFIFSTFEINKETLENYLLKMLD